MSRLFISYAHETEAHRARVRALADRLKGDDIDTMVDAYDPHPREGWLKWMEKHTRAAEHILIIPSPRYVSEFRQEVPSSSGARYEGAIISAQIAKSGVDYRRFLIGLFDDYGGLDLPDILYACPRYRLDQSDGYQKLLGYLAGSPPRADHAGPVASAPTAPVERILPPDRCFGRDADIAALISALLAPHAAVVVLGGPGIGKTTLTRQVATSDELATSFGERRWFVPLETAADAAALRTAIVVALGGNPADPGAFDHALARLREAPGLLVLDNLETPWEADMQAVQETLRRLAAVPDVTLLASVRGSEAPDSPAWSHVAELEPLPRDAARRLFLTFARKIGPDDPLLDRFLDELGDVPLAVELAARRAAPHASLAGPWDDWQRRGIELAKHPNLPEGRLTSVLRSIDLSWQSSRLHDEGRRLFRLLGALPAGMAREDSAALLGDDATEAARQLLAIGLAVERGERLDLLPPVRDAARRLYPPSAGETDRWCQHFLHLARALGERVGANGGADAVARLAPEVSNLDASFAAALTAEQCAAAVAAAYGFAELQRFTGLGSSVALLALSEANRMVGDAAAEAHCLRQVGKVELARWDHNRARAAHERALPLFRQVGDVLGEADCVKGLGDIARQRSEYEVARENYVRASALFRQVGNSQGEANCIRRLGDIALACSDYDASRASYNLALPLFRQVGFVRGEAACILRLGQIALALSRHNEAQTALEKALPLFHQIGDLLGEANCIKSLGDIALARSQRDTVRAAYEQALLLFRQVGNVRGEANCIQSLGDIARATGETAAARERYVAALALYERIPEPFSIGWTHFLLAELSDGAERAAHVAAARAAWVSIDRPDLIAEHLDPLG